MASIGTPGDTADGGVLAGTFHCHCFKRQQSAAIPDLKRELVSRQASQTKDDHLARFKIATLDEVGQHRQSWC